MESNIHLKINLFCLALVGLWPIKIKGAFSFLNKLHWIYSKLAIIYFILFVFSQIIEFFYILDHDVQEMLFNLEVTLLYIVCLVKMWACTSKYIINLVKIISDTEIKLFSGNDEALQKIYMTYVAKNYYVDKLLIYVGIITIFGFFINPALLMHFTLPGGVLVETAEDNSTIYRPKPLPFSSWFPFNKYKYYYVSYTFDVISGSYGASFVVYTDIFFFGLMLFAIGQIKCLQYILRNLRNYANELKDTDGNLTEQEAIYVVVRDCAKFHQEIISYVKDLDESLRFLMLLDFCICSMQIAIICFYVVVSGFSLPQLFALEYLSAMLIQLFLFYWNANELLLESVEISKAIWDSDWSDCEEKVKRTLLLIMLRSQRPLTLSVGPFYEMSTSTALSLLRGSYSYVALMRQFYKRK